MGRNTKAGKIGHSNEKKGAGSEPAPINQREETVMGEAGKRTAGESVLHVPSGLAGKN